MQGQGDQDWSQYQSQDHQLQYLNYYSSPTQPPMRGMQDLDLSMFQNDTPLQQEPYASNSTPLAYFDNHRWTCSNADMGTPSTTFSYDTYQPEPQPYRAHFRPPPSPHRPSNPSPHPHLLSAPTVPRLPNHRPPLPRSTTAPEPRSQNPRPTHFNPNPRLSPNPSDSDADADADANADADLADAPSPPAKTPPKPPIPTIRPRKRSRIPHTAVERRYRENLNSHLEKLRQSIPALTRTTTTTTTTTTQGEAGGTGVKPSKCEILAAAVEVIASLERENRGLREEVEGFRRRGGEGAGGRRLEKMG